jgi:hypothetical protein
LTSNWLTGFAFSGIEEQEITLFKSPKLINSVNYSIFHF